MSYHAAAILERLQGLGVAIVVDGHALRLRPASLLPPELLEEVRCCKPEVIALLTTPPDTVDAPNPFDPPFPVGYAGLPVNEVIAAEAINDKDGIIDPIRRKMNVLCWISSGMAYKGDTGEMYQAIKAEYHRLGHVGYPGEACGICDSESGEPS